MIKLKAFSTLLFLFLALHLSAQHRFSGIVKNAADNSPLAGASLVATFQETSLKTTTFSDEKGQFLLSGLHNGSYDLSVAIVGYRTVSLKINIEGKDTSFNVILEPLSHRLNEVKIFEEGNKFGFDRLRAIDGMAIFAGKKSEVIIPENLTINAATNNARQLYSRVAGLNIYENDGAGLQLSIGGRGLDPNRTANFNVRQNGYDISADALGYPESYYTPPIEAVGRIQIVRGAASLQYGTQFGGLLNFILKRPVQDKLLEIVSRQSVGSNGFFNSFNSISGTKGKLGYYGFFQYKRGDGWRPNSDFNSYTGYGYMRYDFSENTSINGQYTHMDYTAKQSGGLTDRQFNSNPKQSNRARNWFKVNWNLFDIEFQHKFSQKTSISINGFGLIASRLSLGFRPNRPETPDDNGPRDLIDGNFHNWGTEARLLQRYTIASKPSTLLIGARYYRGLNSSKQGEGSNGSQAEFSFSSSEELMFSDYKLPSANTAFFAENIFNINSTFSITPGLRFEYIKTVAEGYYRNISKDLAGNIIENRRFDERLSRPRSFMLFGVGASYKPTRFF